MLLASSWHGLNIFDCTIKGLSRFQPFECNYVTSVSRFRRQILSRDTTRVSRGGEVAGTEHPAERR